MEENININYRWCKSSDKHLLNELAELFVINAANYYISHGEVIDGRADNMNEWKTDIKTILHREFSNAINNTFDMPDTFTRLVVAQRNATLIGLALVEFHPDTRVAILCDIVVDTPLRGYKIGESLLHWIEVEVKQWGAKFLFLESGNENHAAHHFFKKAGFNGVSIVMMKEL